MLILLRRSLPPALVCLGALACSHPAADSPRAVGGHPARPTAAMPAYVDSVDARAVAKTVVLCTTTADDLSRRLGAPTRDGVLHRAHILSWSTRSETPSRYLAVMVDGRGVVVDLYWDVPLETTWVPADQCATPDGAPPRPAGRPRTAGHPGAQ